MIYPSQSLETNKSLGFSFKLQKNLLFNRLSIPTADLDTVRVYPYFFNEVLNVLGADTASNRYFGPNDNDYFSIFNTFSTERPEYSLQIDIFGVF